MVSIGDSLELKRGDLLTFPKETVDLILKMQKEGWRGHRNNKGHVKMLAPDGVTYVMATQNPNSPTYLRSGYNQYVKKNGGEEVNAVLPKGAQKWPCARPGCPKVYATQEQLNNHIAVDHEGMLMCEYTGCFEVRPTKQKLTIHMTHAHGYVSPRKAQRKKQEAARAAKQETIAAENEVEKTLKAGIEGARAVGKQIANTLKESQGPRFINDGVAVIPATHEETHDLPDNVEVLEIDFEGLAKEDPVAIEQLSKISVEEVYEQTNRKLAEYRESAKNVGVVRTDDDLEFLDTRDSWVVDDPELMSHSVTSIQKILKSVGLEMEIRVWRKKE